MMIPLHGAAMPAISAGGARQRLQANRATQLADRHRHPPSHALGLRAYCRYPLSRYRRVKVGGPEKLICAALGHTQGNRRYAERLADAAIGGVGSNPATFHRG
jgi:hypothetical protein